MKLPMSFHGAVFGVLALTSPVQAQAWDDDGDDPVQWIIDNGFSSIQFMERCVSIAPNGQQITSEPLPVGGGYWISCNTYSQIAYDATEVQANDGSRYCVLGSLNGSSPGGDDRLQLEIVDDGTFGRASVQATASEPTLIYLVSAFGGAQAWPIWLTSDYQTQQLVRAPNDGRTCKQVFGL